LVQASSDRPLFHRPDTVYAWPPFLNISGSMKPLEDLVVWRSAFGICIDPHGSSSLAFEDSVGHGKSAPQSHLLCFFLAPLGVVDTSLTQVP
nr:hypothetical protein [Tanacetum cinerariifolium]